MAEVKPRSLGPDLRIGVLVALLGAASAGCYLAWLRHWGPSLGQGRFPVVALAATFAVFEIFVVHLEYRREVHSVSLSEMALVAGLVFFSPTDLLVARLVGSMAVLVLHRRQWSVKLPLNLASFAGETVVATLVYRAVLGVHPALSAPGAVAAIAAVLSADMVGTVLIVGAISIYEWRPQRAMLRDGLGIETLAAVVCASAAILACEVIWAEPGLAFLLVVVGAVACGCFRGYAALRQRYASLELLYGFTRSVGTSEDTGQATETLLRKAADLLRAEVSEIALFDDDRGTALRSSVVDGRLETAAVSFDPDDSLELHVARSGTAVLAGRLTKDRDVARGLAERDFKDALVIPLRRNGAVVGTFLVADRLGHVSTFDAEDLKLFETIGLHASTTLENGRLIDRLREEAASKEYQSLHDTLTGLPNRTMFHQMVEKAIGEDLRTGTMGAVMLMDLDRFKEINDTLGHQTGDQLLIQLSRRLTQVLGAQGYIARLGGDEFALLVPGVTALSETEAVAGLVLAALEHPLAVAGINLQVGASIGLAAYPEHATDSSSLLQLADVAMYQAKDNHSGYMVYASGRDRHDARRLALAAELRAAIERGQVTVHYQPKADVATRQIKGVEALVRWEHPTFGMVGPDEFVPIAEQTGLIRLLTEHVLQSALHQCRDWQRLGFCLSMAVNLSVRNLMDRDLPDRVAELLVEAGLAPEMLTLEITEGTIMADPFRTLEVLNRLAAMGVTLSIDDFGTGYSSLSYLKRLPVREVKIDRSFVHNMTSDADDKMIVQSVIDLARNLHLGVVAEGVEDGITWDCLAALGCDSVQGYYLSKPNHPEVITQWLIDRGTDISAWAGDRNTVLEPLPGIGGPARPTLVRS